MVRSGGWATARAGLTQPAQGGADRLEHQRVQTDSEIPSPGVAGQVQRLYRSAKRARVKSGEAEQSPSLEETQSVSWLPLLTARPRRNRHFRELFREAIHHTQPGGWRRHLPPPQENRVSRRPRSRTLNYIGWGTGEDRDRRQAITRKTRPALDSDEGPLESRGGGGGASPFQSRGAARRRRRRRLPSPLSSPFAPAGQRRRARARRSTGRRRRRRRPRHIHRLRPRCASEGPETTRRAMGPGWAGGGSAARRCKGGADAPQPAGSCPCRTCRRWWRW